MNNQQLRIHWKGREENYAESTGRNANEKFIHVWGHCTCALPEPSIKSMLSLITNKFCRSNVHDGDYR